MLPITSSTTLFYETNFDTTEVAYGYLFAALRAKVTELIWLRSKWISKLDKNRHSDAGDAIKPILRWITYQGYCCVFHEYKFMLFYIAFKYITYLYLWQACTLYKCTMLSFVFFFLFCELIKYLKILFALLKKKVDYIKQKHVCTTI